ncbi:MAG: corrinoid protein [Chloroflexota bacterium]
MNDDKDITKVPPEELFCQMIDDLYRGDSDKVVADVNQALAGEILPQEILDRGLIAGMEKVSVNFRDGVLFIPEVLLAAQAMQAGVSVLKPWLAETEATKAGTIVIGTVLGDIHDIGKNIVAIMMEGAGFEVIDLGINQSVGNFLSAIKQHHPDILGMSTLLTTTMPYMRTVIEALEQEGLREDLIVLVGGAPLNEAFAKDIGADAYCRDAAVAVETAKKYIRERKT